MDIERQRLSRLDIQPDRLRQREPNAVDTSDDVPEFSAAHLIAEAKRPCFALYSVGCWRVRETVTDGTTVRSVSHEEQRWVEHSVPVLTMTETLLWNC